ncbi:PhzF family phenazine biosynthesis protein [Variovorax sp. LT1R16]|uniref:PhzF family phenazine biosynthesis protein n=1 Tax=Variovorax sp. LT1R16 TaxID=3443728 RepID=UPI003F478290
MELIRVFSMPGSDRGGNPAPVWLAADALSSAQMLERTRDSGHESVFVLRPSDPAAHDWRMRHFVPRHEMEMCGHATIGALWLLHRDGHWRGQPTTVETLSGTVHGRHVDGRVEISQPRATVQTVGDALRDEIARCLHIAPTQIIGPVLNASTSRVKTLIRLQSVEALHALQPDFTGVEALCERLGSTGLYPYAVANDTPATVSARQFPKSSGYPEDAATGIAAAALAWGLREAQLVGDAATLVTVRQGEAMGSPSAIFVRLPAATAITEGCWLRGEAQAMSPPLKDTP